MIDIDYERWVRLCYKESARMVSKMFHIKEDDDYFRNIQMEIFRDLIKRYDKKVLLFEDGD